MTYYTKSEDGEFVEVTENLYTETQYKEIKTKNNELRTTNTTLLKSNESLSAFAEVLDGVQNITPDGLMKKIDEKARQRAEALVTEMKAKHELSMKELSEKYESSSAQLNKLVLGEAVRKAGPKHGVQDTAYDDVLRRADADFKVEDGKVVFKHEKFDSNGQPYNVDTWLADTIKSAPHLAVTPKGPPARQNSMVRSNSLNNGEKRTAAELIASGLANKTPGATKSLT